MMTARSQRSVILGFGSFLLLAGTTCAQEENKYVGVEKCKTCHSAAAKGDAYGAWTKMKHAHAYATLASPEGKKLAAEKKVDDPQKNEACVSCHVTAYGVPAAQKHKKFDETLGVQCESCHGPGGKHVAARMEAAEGDEKIGKDEIVSAPTIETCKKCHNEKSPNYKPLCFKKAAKATAHLDPRRKHPADYFDKLPCDCPECKK